MSAITVDKTFSRHVARLLDTRKDRSYSQVLRAVKVLPELGSANYIEGWAVDLDSNEVFPHAWIELNDRIVDPLLYHALLAYFPGGRERNDLLGSRQEARAFAENLAEKKGWMQQVKAPPIPTGTKPY